MNQILKYYLFCFALLTFSSCSKEEIVNVLQTQYEPTVKEIDTASEDFTVVLQARALQSKERGEWSILKGVQENDYVYFGNENNPITAFKGLPGEEYTLQWERWDVNGKSSVVEFKVNIPKISIEILDKTKSEFQTIRTLVVDSKFKGKWSFDKPYAHLDTRYHDGLAEPVEYKPELELHGYANTSYTATYTYTYAGKAYQFQKLIQTGDYTEDEALYEIRMPRSSGSIVTNRDGNILELNLQSSIYGHFFNNMKQFPALQALKHLRKLNLAGSSAENIPEVLGAHYHQLEDLNMDGMGTNLVFPDNFGNLTKLKKLIARPLNGSIRNREIILPASFGKLESLESFIITNEGYLNFNGTMGELKNLQYLEAYVKEIPGDIGKLKKLQYAYLHSRSTTINQQLTECDGLKYLALRFDESPNGRINLPARLGDLKSLETFDISTNMLYQLPATVSDLASLKTLSIAGANLLSVPDDFGKLKSLEVLALHGTFSTLPNSFGQLHNLKSFVMTSRVEHLPESFCNLSSLNFFNAEYTTLRKLPENFGQLKNLEDLNLSHTKIQSLPKSFGELDALSRLNLTYSALNTFPKEIIPLKSVTRIVLSGTQTGDIPDDVSKMKSGIEFQMQLVPNLTVDHMIHIASLTQGILFYTSVGFFS